MLPRLKKYSKDILVVIPLVAGFCLWLFMLYVVSVNFYGYGGQLVLHVNSLREIDIVGSSLSPFILLSLSFLLFLLNFFLSFFFYFREKFLSYIFAYSNLVILLFSLTSFLVLGYLN